MAVFRPTYRDKKTGERKHSRTWWYEFAFGGKIIRESAKTQKKTVAREAEKRRRAEMERAFAGIPTEDPKQRFLTVSTVLAKYQRDYRLGHANKSVAWVKERSAHLERLLGQTLVADLTEDRIREYQYKRLDKGAGPRTINMEIECLSRAVGRPWGVLWPRLERLTEPKSSGRAIAPEQRRTIRLEAGKSKSPVILPSIEIALCGLRPKETRLLRWGDVDLEGATLVVPESKTEAGEQRIVGLSPEAVAALRFYLASYVRWFGEIKRDWFVFPRMSRVRGVDPTQPIGSFRKAWERIRDKAGIQARFYDWRHTTITELLESGVPEQVVENIVGHVDPQVKKRYSHVRKQAALDAAKRLQQHRDSIEPLQESLQVSKSETIQ